MLSASFAARNERGNPPRHHRSENPSPVDLHRLESGKLQVLDPSGQRLGRLAEQIGPGAAEDQEPAPGVRVDQDPQDREQVGPALHFVDHGNSGDGLQRGHRLVQTCEIERIFEVEIAG